MSVSGPMSMAMAMSMAVPVSDSVVAAADHVANTGPDECAADRRIGVATDGLAGNRTDARADQGAGVGPIVATAQYRGGGEQPGKASCQCSAMAT